jgi:hypothetical protein
MAIFEGLNWPNGHFEMAIFEGLNWPNGHFEMAIFESLLGQMAISKWPF